MVIASNLHSFWHLPQPIHAAEQFFLATAPLSLFMQLTTIRRPFGPFLRSSMIWRGQALTQAPQATHFSSSTSGSPVSSFMWIASNVQARVQSPQPRQPKPQRVSPVPVAFIAAQVRKPLYSMTRGRCSQVPLQRTTAIFGSVLATAIPSKSATCDIVSCPPTGQSNPSREPASQALTNASAIPEQPGNPHPPQLAPGSASSTCPIRGSS